MEAGSGLRRKDTTKGPPLRILSLDGGGVRGYSMLIILQELMHRTYVEIEGKAPKRHETPKPCEHFDLIVGTGTGGLIALMLGRMRMDIDTCKDVYVRMTKRVFETDKTIAGIPYRSTLFKASKLEEAIRECVRAHTISEYEGNDMPNESSLDLKSPMTPGSAYSGVTRSMSTSSRYSQIGMTPVNPSNPIAAMRFGNPNAMLYDTRENRTKTAVTAVYKGSSARKQGSSSTTLLRSYDSRKESTQELSCTIWQAGRATSATALAFKPIQIGQSIFLDEGNGKYNPCPLALDEAVCNEWPGREVGVVVSVGTGKRPPSSAGKEHQWWEGFVGGGMGDFAEARRRLIAKIEGCEQTHQYMLKEHLSERQVSPENYYRLNVEVGVGEFGMNEWNRLSDISTNTRVYLSRPDTQAMNFDAAAKLARIHRAKQRWERQQRGEPPVQSAFQKPWNNEPPPPANPMAVELPAEPVEGDGLGVHPAYREPQQPQQQQQLLSPSHQPRASITNEKFIIAPEDFPLPQSATTASPLSPNRLSADFSNPYARRSNEMFPGPQDVSPRVSSEYGGPPPPIPPKTPLQQGGPPPGAGHRPRSSNPLPYPDDDGPPPIVNKARKPEWGAR